MPVHYVIGKEQNLILSIGEGVVTFAEIKAHQDRLLADPERAPQFNQLIDMVAVQRLELSIDFISLIEGTKSQISPAAPPSVYRARRDRFVQPPLRPEQQRAWVRRWQSRGLRVRHVCLVVSAPRL